MFSFDPNQQGLNTYIYKVHTSSQTFIVQCWVKQRGAALGPGSYVWVTLDLKGLLTSSQSLTSSRQKSESTGFRESYSFLTGKLKLKATQNRAPRNAIFLPSTTAQNSQTFHGSSSMSYFVDFYTASIKCLPTLYASTTMCGHLQV